MEAEFKMTSITNRRFQSGLLALTTLAIVLALSAPAFAQSTLSGYGGQDDKAQSEVKGVLQDSGSGPGPTAVQGTENGNENKTVTASKSDTGSLPFTGFELGLMLAVGASLLVIGVGLRRIVRSRSPLA